MFDRPHDYVAPSDPKRSTCVQCGRSKSHPTHTGVNPNDIPKDLTEVRAGLLDIRAGFPCNSRAHMVLTFAHECLDPKPSTLDS